MFPAFRELEDHITNPTETSSDYKLSTCAKNDAKATAIIESTFSDENRKHGRDNTSPVDMWSTIVQLVQQNTLRNKLTTRRKLYSAKIPRSEMEMGFISQVRQLGAD